MDRYFCIISILLESFLLLLCNDRQQKEAHDAYKNYSERKGISIPDTMALLHIVRKYNISSNAADELFKLSSSQEGERKPARSLFIAEQIEKQLVPQLVQTPKLIYFRFLPLTDIFDVLDSFHFITPL